MMPDQGRQVEVCDTVSVSQAECAIVDIRSNALEPPTSHSVFAGIDHGDGPRLGIALVDDGALLAHADRDIGCVQDVVREELFDHVALVSKADHEVADAKVGVHLHDVPQDRHATDLDHGLGAEMRLFANASAHSTGENDCFHEGIA